MLKQLLALAVGLAISGCAFAKPPAIAVPENVLDTLNKTRPRLILTDTRLAEIKTMAEKDPVLARAINDVLEKAREILKEKPIVQEKKGLHQLKVSRKTLRHVYYLGLAWRLTGKEEFAAHAIEDLKTVCAFDTWNPKHFLDVAEMTHAVGVGYDWFYSHMDAATRETVRKRLIKLGLEQGIKGYKSKPQVWWANIYHNWNLVCNDGLMIGALALADSDPEIANTIMKYALAGIPKALATYAPDGAWPEGPGYWAYATDYMVYGLAALDTALGRDFGLSGMPGFSETGFFPLLTTGPTGLYINFADAGEKSSLKNLPPLYWLAKRFNHPEFAAAEQKIMQTCKAEPLDVIWYQPVTAKPAPLPNSRYFRGPVEVAVLSGDREDTASLFVSLKAGFNKMNHAHLDLGNFELDAMGQRWSRDIGSDSYSLPEYFGKQRWNYFRLKSGSHSVPLLDGKDQNLDGESKMLKFEADARGGFALADLSKGYSPAAEKVLRGVRAEEGYRAALVQDEFQLKSPCEVVWAMTTDASIQPAGAEAVLTLSGKTLRAKILSPEGAAFTVESADKQTPQERPNKGVSRLLVRLPAGEKKIRVTVLLAPVWPDGKTVTTANVIPLDKW